MDNSDKVKRLIHPRENANALSLLTFFYTGRLFVRGYKKELEDDDLYDVINKCRSKKCADKMEQAYNSRLKTKDPENDVSLLKILWNLYGVRYLALGLFHMTGRVLVSIYEPEAVSNLVGYFKPGQKKMTIYDAMYYAGLMVGLKAFHTIYFQNYTVYLGELALQIRVAFSSVIYRKALRLSPKALEDTSLGNIVTVITRDVTQFEQSINLFNELWIATIQTILICYLIYVRAGVASLVGVLLLILVIPIQAYISKLIRNLRLKMAKRTDQRLQRLQETLSTIKIIKMYTWEKFFADTILESRLKELKSLMKSQYLKMSLMITSSMVAKFSFYSIIVIYIWLNNDMSPETIFYVMKIFGHLRITLAMSFSMGFTKIGELTASLKRINHILQLEELPEFIDKPDDQPQIDIRNASLTLKNHNILKHISLKLEVGLNVLTGQLGSGKSSLIKAILRDYPVDEGEVRTRGRKSYASQDAWLFPSSIKQNILFGENYDYKRYTQVVHACALEYDFQILEKGDETIVADRGMNLSKGQQARINLARAIYKDSDIYLIDDALTALDPRVQEHIFTYCIQGILQNKCVVLVTHNPKHIKLADNLVIMQNGAIKFVGKQENISEDLLEAVEADETFEKVNDTNDDVEDKEDENEQLIKQKPEGRRRQVYHENKKSGSIAWGLYSSYIKCAGGFFLLVILIAFFGVVTFVDSASQKILSNWINEKAIITSLKESYIQNTTLDLDEFETFNTTTVFLNSTFNVSTDHIHEIQKLEVHASKTINMYTISIFVFAVFDLIKHYIMIKVGVNASLNIHKQMLSTVINAFMTFFDSFFIGNILNRFAQDLGIIDEHVSHVIFLLLNMMFHLGGVVGIMVTINWKFLIPVIVLVVVSVLLRSVYIKTSRSLKRLEAATRSPIVGHLNSTLDGLTTIRAYKAQEILKNEYDRHQDLYSSAFYTSMCSKGAFGFFMEFASLFFITAVIVRFLFFDADTIAGDVGLALTQAGMLSMIINGGLMVWSDVENSMTSVERAMEYTVIETEDRTGPEIENWPNKGHIVYKEVSLKYANSQEKILNNVSFEVKSRNKIGIVGRTGAGKSTIISSLFRLYNYEGQILIDGTELKSVSLEFLRQSISIIPQDPVMFSGTIRSNIDPRNEFTDEEIWKTLHKVHLDSHVPKLETHVNDLNFSTGQRQLICLARAMIRKNKIVVLDEATANMDPETEQLAQKIIDENFSACTLLIIAHRLDTILDCNKVLVLDKGEVVEFDSPLELLKNPKGVFSEMVRNAGINEPHTKTEQPK